MKRVLLVVNLLSGMGAARDLLYNIVMGLSLADCEVTVVPLLFPARRTTAQILERAQERYDVISCFGGDGTLNHLVDEYVRQGITLPIGYLPAGSTNDFARSLSLPADCNEGARIIAGDRLYRYDVGIFNGRAFNYIAAFGAFTKVSYETSQTFKNMLGYAAYIVTALFSVAESYNIRCPMVIEHDGVREEGSFIFGAVSNSTSVAGFKVPFEHEVRMDDGVFEVILIRAPESFADFTHIIGCLAVGNLNSPYIQAFQTTALTIHAKDNTAWTLDGEYGGTPQTVEITALRQRVPLLVPQPPEQTA